MAWFAAAFPWLLGAVVVVAIVGAAYSYCKEKNEENKPHENNPEPEPPKTPDQQCCWCLAFFETVVTLKVCQHKLCTTCYKKALEWDSRCIDCGKNMLPQKANCINCGSPNLVQCRPCGHELFCVDCVKEYISLGGECLRCPEKVTAYI